MGAEQTVSTQRQSTQQGLPVAAGTGCLSVLAAPVASLGDCAGGLPFQAGVPLQALSEVRHSNQRLEQALQDTSSSLKETERQAAEDKAAWARRLEEQEAARWGMTHRNTPSECVATCGHAWSAPCWPPAQQVFDGTACWAAHVMPRLRR